MEVEEALRAIRAGALHAPECLNSGDAQGLAGVLQAMSAAVATVAAGWERLGTGKAAEAEHSSRLSSAGQALDAFDAAVTSHMIVATASTFRSRDLGKPQTFSAPLLPETAQQAAAELAVIVEQVRKAAPGLMLTLCNAGGAMNVAAKDACEIKLGYQNVFSASIGLAGPGRPEILRVVLDSYDKAVELDPWTHSAHTVFRRLSSLAMRALAYLQRRASCWHIEHTPQQLQQQQQQQSQQLQQQQQQQGAGSAGCSTSVHGTVLEDMLLWLTAFRDLFSRPCCITGKLLAGDSSTQHPTPPVYRNFKCSRQELLAQASDASLIKAFHMHVVPEELLDWCPPADAALL